MTAGSFAFQGVTLARLGLVLAALWIHDFQVPPNHNKMRKGKQNIVEVVVNVKLGRNFFCGSSRIPVFEPTNFIQMLSFEVGVSLSVLYSMNN